MLQSSKRTSMPTQTRSRTSPRRSSTSSRAVRSTAPHRRSAWLTYFHSTSLAVPDPNAKPPQSPQGQVPNSYAFALSQVNATKLAGGSVKIVDSTTFPVCSQRNHITQLLIVSARAGVDDDRRGGGHGRARCYEVSSFYCLLAW